MNKIKMSYQNLSCNMQEFVRQYGIVHSVIILPTNVFDRIHNNSKYNLFLTILGQNEDYVTHPIHQEVPSYIDDETDLYVIPDTYIGGNGSNGVLIAIKPSIHPTKV